MSKASIVCALVGSLSLVAAPVDAVLISFSTSGDSATVDLENGLDAEVVLEPDGDSVDLTPGVAETVFFNAGSVGLFQGINGGGFGTLSQTLTINSPSSTPLSQSVSQNIFIDTYAPNPPFDPATADVVLSSGSTVTFNLGGLYTLEVTPQSSSRIGQTSTEIVISNNAQFLLEAIPEPAAATLLLGAAGLFLNRRRVR